MKTAVKIQVSESRPDALGVLENKWTGQVFPLPPDFARRPPEKELRQIAKKQLEKLREKE